MSTVVELVLDSLKETMNVDDDGHTNRQKKDAIVDFQERYSPDDKNDCCSWRPWRPCMK